MEPWAIIKIVMMIVGGMVVLDHTPGIDVFKDDRADYKELVKCEAKYEGLARKSKELARECRVTLGELKKQKKETKKLERKNRKLEKALETEKRDYQGCVESLDSALSDRRDGGRGRLRGREDRGSGDKDNGWKRIYPWR